MSDDFNPEDRKKLLNDLEGRLRRAIQPTLDLVSAKDERDKAILRVEEHANEEFKIAALESVQRLALARPMLCSDDVWATRETWPPTRDRRVLGSVMQTAKRNKWIEPTGEFRPTSQVASHASPMRFWRSLIYREM